MKDKYDLAVEYLTERPEEITKAWWQPLTHRAGCLFDYATDDRLDCSGCLTQVKSGQCEAKTLALTNAIRQDPAIPSRAEDIKVEHLPLFAQWQRRIDKELGRKP